MVAKYLEPCAKYAGLITVCLEWLACVLFYTLRSADFNGQQPISYFASFPETRLVFSVCLTIAAISFWVFTSYHLPKYYVVPVRLFTASMLGYAVLALMPFDPHDAASQTIHKVLALFFSLTFLGGVYLMGKHNKDSHVRPMSYMAVILSALILVIFLVMPKDSQFILLFEVISALIGQLWIIWISFHSFRKAKARP
jgi:hypothetical protein